MMHLKKPNMAPASVQQEATKTRGRQRKKTMHMKCVGTKVSLEKTKIFLKSITHEVLNRENHPTIFQCFLFVGVALFMPVSQWSPLPSPPLPTHRQKWKA